MEGGRKIRDMTDGGAAVSMLGRASVQRPCFIVQIDKKGQGFRSFSGKKEKNCTE